MSDTNKTYGGWFRMQIGKVSNLLSIMALKGATVDEIERAVCYSELLIRFAKEKDQDAAEKICEESRTILKIKDLEKKYYE